MSYRSNEDRLERIVNLLIEYSRGNFESPLEVGEDDDPLNTVIAGLNMLGEELAHYKKQLDEKNVFLQDILSSIDEVIYAREVNHENHSISPFTFISRQSYDILGIDTEQLFGQPDMWSKGIHPEDIGPTRELAAKIFKGKPEVLSFRMFNPVHNEYRWIEDRIMPKVNKDGVVTHLFGSARDVTDQRTINLELEDKSLLISRIITSSDQLFYIVMVNEEDQLSNRFSYLSWQAEKILGSSIEEIHDNALRWFDAIHPDDREQLMLQNKAMFSSKQPAMRIYRIRHVRTGEYIWLEDYAVPVADSTGCIRELYGSARDITARKNAEQAREKLIKELSNKYNELMQFNYIVSHNLRAPVAHIKGLSALLDMNMPQDEVRSTFEYIREAAESMDELLVDLNIILSTRSMLNEKVEPISLMQVIDTVRNNLRNEIENSGVNLKVHIGPGADELTSIKSYIQSAIYNLVANAIKYRDELRPLEINISAHRINGRTVIIVADNGLGIDLEANASRIFGMYNRFHHGHEGKGLGLYMTKTQIESLNGTIAVESKVGIGTTFTITL